MGFIQRMPTTGKVEILDEVRKEVETTYLHSTVSIVENNKIPKSMKINLGQTPSKCVPGYKKTLAPKRIKSFSVAGSTDKRTITATFNITTDGKFLPMQIICGGKTSKSIPQHQNLTLDSQYPALLIMNVFKGHTTKQVKDLLNENNIKFQKVLYLNR